MAHHCACAMTSGPSDDVNVLSSSMHGNKAGTQHFRHGKRRVPFCSREPKVLLLFPHTCQSRTIFCLTLLLLDLVRMFADCTLGRFRNFTLCVTRFAVVSQSSCTARSHWNILTLRCHGSVELDSRIVGGGSRCTNAGREGRYQVWRGP